MPSLHRVHRIGHIWAAETAVIVGDVVLGADCNVWHQCVIRGDVAPIRVGERVNVQDGAILHCKHNVTLEIASDVAIAHQALVHCTRVGTRTLIGSRSTLLDDCEIGDDCLIAAGAVLAPGTKVPSGSVVMGMPGKVVREIRDSERTYIQRVLQTYLDLSRRHEKEEFVAYPPRD